MIFITVGTHEQSFDRLIKEIDKLKENGSISDEVFIQNGYSKYIPKYCQYKEMLGYDEMCYYVERSRIIITHGGPGSIFLPIQYGKKPIVVPRNPDFDEHVDYHQIDFAKRMYNQNRIDIVLDINDLESKIKNYRNYSDANNKNDIGKFIEEFNSVVDNLFKCGN